MSAVLKTLIVDDERLAREELRALLMAHNFVDVIGEAGNANDANAISKQQRPDVIFLDVEMPGQTGIEFAAALPQPSPAIIFTTAYDNFAFQAFGVNAIDYLLKPVDPVRLASALKKVPLRADELSDATLDDDDHVFVRDGDRCWFVSVRSIGALEADGNHTKVHLGDGSPVIYRTLLAMESRLPSKLFLRANRNFLINLTHIESIDPWFGGSIKVRLRGGREVEFSRRQAQIFRDRLSL